MVKILNYIHARRTMAAVTGVGQHMMKMSLGLNARPDVQQMLLASRPEVQMQAEVDPQWALRNLPTRTFPASRGIMEKLWWATHWPKAERWFPEADWVYVAADAYIPTRRARFAVTIHDVYFFEDNLPWSGETKHAKARRTWRARLRPILANVDVILTVSEFSKQRIEKLLSVDPAKIVVIGNGIDPAEFNEQDALDPEFAVGPPYLLVIGGLKRRKGAEATLELARRLAARKSNVRIIVVGKGEAAYLPELKALPNIVELGYAPAQRLPGLLRGALGLLFLSIYEGFGIPIIEAFACGTPAIISQHSSLPEVGGDAAIVVREGQLDEAVNQIELLEKNSAYRAALVERGRPIAQKFTWDNCVQRLVDVFNSSISRSR